MNEVSAKEKLGDIRKKIVICTIKSWNIKKANEFAEKYSSLYDIRIISEKEQLNLNQLKEFAPSFIFFPHWSNIIPDDILECFECVVFHMTDLPFGRGGSPLQNMIVRGMTESVVSAIRVVGEIDAGPVYMKCPLSLYGSAEEIYIRASDIIFEKMIPEISKGHIKAQPQKGKPVVFRRRKPDESELNSKLEISQIYDRVRMLDAEDYPNAFIKFGQYKISFSRASITADGIRCDAIISMD